MTHPSILHFDEIDSTNAEARRRTEGGETGPLWLRAARQTAGRGRRGRTWESQTGNLFATLLTTTDKPPSEAAQMSFVAALAVHTLAKAFAPDATVTVKWPNDVLMEGKKLAGILVESGRSASDGQWLAIGIGINLAYPPQQAEHPATCIAEHAAPPLPTEAMDALAAAFGHWEKVWKAEGFARIAEVWAKRAHGLGQPCIARLPLETVAGIAEGLDADGALRLRLDDGSVRRITAGDVFFNLADSASPNPGGEAS